MSGLAAAAGPMSTGDAYGLPAPPSPLCTATIGTPELGRLEEALADLRRRGVVVVEEPPVRRVGVHLPRA